MQEHFRIEVRGSTSAEVTLALHGELDLASSGELQQELERLIAARTPRVVVDLSQLEFMDSTGLSVLIRAHERASGEGTQVMLLKVPAQVQRLLRLTGLADRIELADSVEEPRG